MDALTVKSVALFFDRPAVMSALDRYERKVLSRAGAFGRRVMRNSIRKAPQRYTPRPPFPRYHSHPNTGLRLIFFVYDQNAGSVVVGAVKFNSKRTVEFLDRTERRSGDENVPELLNKGGQVTVTKTYRSGAQYQVTHRYRRFTFVDVALEKTAKKLAEIIKETEIQ